MKYLIPLLGLFLALTPAEAQVEEAPVDFSYCGYRAGDADIPWIPARIFIPWQEEDATRVLKEALVHMESLPRDENGFRGAIQLDSGVFRLSGRLEITVPGVVIRGMGSSRTTLLAGGSDRETLIRVEGKVPIARTGAPEPARGYVPVNAMKLTVENADTFSSGDEVRIIRPVTLEWIDTLGMKDFGNPKSDWLGWKEGRSRIAWHRTVVAADEQHIFLDAPLTTALDPEFGGGWVELVGTGGLTGQTGIENLSMESEYDPENPADEDHCWNAISFEHSRDCWVRRVDFRGFAGSAVAVYEGSRRITVEDCISKDPVSEIAGERRHTFFTEGEQVLFQRCWSEEGYHDFSAGNFAPGPNAFVQCETWNSHNFSGCIDRWASGVLFDLVRIDGNALSLKNLGHRRRGAGWSAANCMLWQSQAARIECWSPPTAANYASGTWGLFEGNGEWFDSNSHIRPISLFAAQLEDRVGDRALERTRIRYEKLGSTTSPTADLAQELTDSTLAAPLSLAGWISESILRDPLPTDTGGAAIFKTPGTKAAAPEVKEGIIVKNGWITFRGEVVTGSTSGVKWWNGSKRPYDRERAGAHLTRFVPGRKGSGMTDELEEVVAHMQENHIAAIDHNYGLWYDRRRDDHTRGRQLDADAWAPFYELPFARSGQGTAWDGLSLYDLEKPNLWYWQRLKDFAELAAEQGLLLVHQNYFQHNILEAGAHYADYPWRSANNINQTGFPEPVPYAGDKRIYMDAHYYDTTHIVRKELHRAYIRQCLENFSGKSNVIQHISEEYTGPLHFAQFWLDEVLHWQDENGKSGLIGLGACKNVQDAILDDPIRGARVDLIDIKYWQYRGDERLYAPAGGQHLAPRQHARLVKPGKASFASVHRAVSEYRLRYPDKVVTYSWRLEEPLQWAVFMGGGSMAAIPRMEDSGFLEAAASMRPSAEDKGLYRLQNDRDEQIIYALSGGSIDLSFSKNSGSFSICWLDPEKGTVVQREELINPKRKTTIKAPRKEAVVVLIRKLQ